MRKGILFILGLVCIASHVVNANANNVFNRANQFYQVKQYDSAAVLYNQLIESNEISASIFYNAGNAFYKTNQIGKAVWSYKKSLQVEASKNCSDNLALAQLRIKEPITQVTDIFFIRWWKGLYQLFSVTMWGMLALISFLLGIGILIYKLSNRQVYISRMLAFSLLGISVFCLLFMFVESNYASKHYHAIVIQNTSVLKADYSLSEGVEVEILEEDTSKQSVFVKVKLPDDRVCLISKASLKSL